MAAEWESEEIGPTQRVEVDCAERSTDTHALTPVNADGHLLRGDSGESRGWTGVRLSWCGMETRDR